VFETNSGNSTWRITLAQCSRTTGGTQEDFKWNAAENKLLKIAPEFCLLSDEL
jgi:hypothetical protein